MILFDAVFKGELPSMNEIISALSARNGKYVYGKMKTLNDGLIKWQLKGKARGFKTLEEKVDVNIVWYTKNEKKDPDNVQAGIKFILDSLVDMEVLKNDTRKFVGNIHHYFVTDKKEPKIRIVLTDHKKYNIK